MHVCFHVKLCAVVVVVGFTFSGGPGQIDDHVHLPLWLQVDLHETKKERETESKSVRNNTAEQ